MGCLDCIEFGNFVLFHIGIGVFVSAESVQFSLFSNLLAKWAFNMFLLIFIIKCKKEIDA